MAMEIHIRVTRDQFEKIKYYAESRGKTISQYIRDLVFEEDNNYYFMMYLLEIYNELSKTLKDFPEKLSINVNNRLLKDLLEDIYGINKRSKN